ncbi:MAG: sugar phosphate isomerase/epimerase family protein [Phycisphaerae bacterium]
MKIAFSTLGCPQWDLDTIIAAAREYGYDGVDFRGLQGEMNITKLPEFTDRAQETLVRFQAAGLEIPCFSTGARMFNPDAKSRKASIQEVKKYAEVCRNFGTPMMRVFGGATKGADPEAAVTTAAETLEEMARVARGVTIGVETHDDWVDSSHLAKVFDRVGSANVCIIWDLHHPYQQAGESPSTTFHNIGKFTQYCHVKNSKTDENGKNHLVGPTEGDVPLAQLIGLLRGSGYEGYLTLEWEKVWHPDIAEPEEIFPAYADFLRRVIHSAGR